MRIAVLLCATLRLRAQFDVAVIRPSAADSSAGSSFNVFEGGRLKIVNEPVKLLIRTAFQLPNAQIAGGPGWIETDRYDIEAKIEQAEMIGPGKMSPLIRALLEERFHLKSHREQRPMTVLALVVDKNGPKMKASSDGAASAMNTHGKSQAVATAISMAELANYVGNRLGRVVVDKTGLTPKYDFTLEWAADASDVSAPSLVTALREQLGLKLESQKSMVEVLVIDSIERPSIN